jgi:hypothetical protein
LIVRRLALLFLLCAPAQAADRERALREAVWGGRWLEGSRLYAQLQASGAAPTPQASYLAGLAQWRLRRPEDARPLLKAAADAGFRAGGGRPQPGELVAKIDAYLDQRPPRLPLAGVEAYSEERTPLTAPVLDALPRIQAIGRSVFGDAPPVRYFLFATRARFEPFYRVFAGPRAEAAGSVHSTGVVGAVLFCAEKARRATTAETVSLALHEAQHAWAATYLRRKYDRPILLPPYADEGLAAYVAGLWSPEVAALPARRLAIARARGFTPPPLSDLRTHDGFYAPGRASQNYLAAEQLIERLIGPPEKGAAKIPAFLDAYAATGDDLKAWKAVSGKDAAAEYAALAAGD